MRQAFTLLMVVLSLFSSFPQGKITRHMDKPSPSTRTSKLNVTYNVEDYDAIDLGISVLWSDQNLGASVSDIRGYRYGWSELTPR